MIDFSKIFDSKSVAILLTCEHAGKKIPPHLRPYFRGANAVLNSHRGYDIGAYSFARTLARVTAGELFSYHLTRLLVDQNRDLSHPKAFSEYSQKIPTHLRDELVDEHYQPYRDTICDHIGQLLDSHEHLLHFAIHSFTPVLKGRKRTADFGILYDPQSSRESALAQALQRWLRYSTDMKIKRNYPYYGDTDCLPTTLRRKFGRKKYSGFELELNQGLSAAKRFCLLKALASFIRQLKKVKS